MRSLIGAEELINKINDTYKGHMLEEQYSPLSFKNMVEELAEKTTINAIPIPEGATNGDVIKAMFSRDYTHIYDRSVSSWWNAPYKCNLSEKSTGSESKSRGCGICHYNDGVVHAECVLCDKAESEEK